MQLSVSPLRPCSQGGARGGDKVLTLYAHSCGVRYVRYVLDYPYGKPSDNTVAALDGNDQSKKTCRENLPPWWGVTGRGKYQKSARPDRRPHRL